MAKVYLSLGSNIDKEKNIASCLQVLEELFGELLISSIYESEAVGFEGDHFHNLVVGIETDMPVDELSRLLKKIEDDHGRVRNVAKFSGRRLDIDILTYDDWVGDFDGLILPREEITENAYVLWPLAEIIPDELHPKLKKTYAELWEDYDKDQQQLWVVEY